MSSLSQTLAALPASASVAGRGINAVLERLAAGTLTVVMPDGRRVAARGAAPGPEAELVLRNWRPLRALLSSGDVGLAESYIRGDWDSPDLTALLLLGALNLDALDEPFAAQGWSRALYRLRHWLRANTRRGSRRNIHRHYDLGNRFYAAWLDSTMTYSAALFEGKSARTLEQAQRAKYERILSRLDVKADQTILEIGCGWGAFAEHAARTRGCKVHGITLSREQLAYARSRIEGAGLAERVSLELRDYRDLRGRYDAIVSIEMFEAVGERYWPGYFDTLGRLLDPGGRALVQTITIANHRFEAYRATSDFIQQYIFPGGMLPSPAAFGAEARKAGLKLKNVFAFGDDYAETVARWRKSFAEAWPSIAPLGFDERFRRTWDYYLAYCEAGFRSGNTDVIQVEILRP